MPQFGTRDVDLERDGLPVVTALASEGWASEDAEVLNLTYEFDDTHYLELLPPALHPTIPLYGAIMLRAHDTSPVGPFSVAELRVMGRAGIHQGGYTLGGFASTPEAVELLRDSYGWPGKQGEVRIERKHYATLATVRSDGRTVLDAAMEHSEPITPDAIVYQVSFHLAQVDSEIRLVQAEPHYAPVEAERGTPRVTVFDAAAFGDDRIKLTNPLPATYMRGSVEVRRVRWTMDPKQPAAVGAKRVGS